METLTGALGHFTKGLLLSASVLALWIPRDSWAALHIQKIPEQPQKNQDLLLSVEGIPATFQDLNWYLGEEISGSTRLFSYIPGLQRPQRDGSAMGQRDIVGFPNGSMLLHLAQPTDSGTYQVAVTINPSWTMKAKTEVQVSEKPKELPVAHWPMSAGIMAAVIIGSVATGTLLIGSITYLLVTRGWKGQNPRLKTAEKPELELNHNAGDDIYEVMPSPVLLGYPLGDKGSLHDPSHAATPASTPAAPARQSSLPGTAKPRPCPLLPAGANPLKWPWPAQRGEDTAPGLPGGLSPTAKRARDPAG